MTSPGPFLLAILDGWGEAPPSDGNAITAANTPTMDSLKMRFPFTSLSASGEAVGLPPGQMGNSEVGHLNIGAGRIVYQDLMRITNSIKSGDFFKNPVLVSAVKHALSTGGTLHLMGLLSDGGVHSHIEHLFALIDLATGMGLERVNTHAFLDGRDVPPRSALKYVELLEAKTGLNGPGSIGSIQGRYYAMDRDNRWERTHLAYDAIVHAKAPVVGSASEAILKSYDEGRDDEFLLPRVVGARKPMTNGDSVIFFNFRPDRARQLTRALTEVEFDKFERGHPPVLPYLVTMTEYDKNFGLPHAFPPEEIKNVLADVIAAHGLTQLHIAETEKYAHVTYFFNGGVEKPKPGEDRILIPSPKVSTYDKKPEMSAFEVARETAKCIKTGKYDFIVLNFANCDMVGHTGDFGAAVRAVQAVDSSLKIVLDALWAKGGVGFITADHGNADLMIDGGKTYTAHSLSKVPFINCTPAKKLLRDDGKLGDIAPTVLEVMGLPVPDDMTGVSLFVSP